MRALNIAATGMLAQQLNVEVISNNIANMNTVGYKRQRAEFQDLLYQNLERAGAQSSDQGTIVPTGVQVGAGVRAGSVYRIGSQGAMTATGNKLDLAISGRGYFQVLTEKSGLPSLEILVVNAGRLRPFARRTMVIQTSLADGDDLRMPRHRTQRGPQVLRRS